VIVGGKMTETIMIGMVKVSKTIDTMKKHIKIVEMKEVAITIVITTTMIITIGNKTQTGKLMAMTGNKHEDIVRNTRS
jgi:hypothetical protein